MTDATHTSQAAAILAHLQSGKRITGLKALELFGCIHLPRRILDLREAGHAIAAEWITTDSGKRCREYRLEQDA